MTRSAVERRVDSLLDGPERAGIACAMALGAQLFAIRTVGQATAR
jgi:hypothetical protein